MTSGIDPNLLLDIAVLANKLLETKWKKDRIRFPTLTPPTCPKLSVVEVDTVIEAYLNHKKSNDSP